MDGDIRLSRPLARGRLDLGFAATWLFAYDVRTTPTADTQRRLDTTTSPAAIRFRTSATWERGILAATAVGNYVDGYIDNTALPYRSISSFLTIDANVGLSPKHGRFRNMRLALSVTNLLDAAPPFVNQPTGLGFDAANANPFGRSVAIEIASRF